MTAITFGVLCGYLNNNFGSVVAGTFVSDYLFQGSLYVLLFVMGLSFGLDRKATSELKKAGLKVLVVPFAVALGSIFGGLVGGLILRLNLFASMAVSAGYGWYTLAGPLVTQFYGAELGALGFASNFLRELLTIVLISYLARMGKYAAVASGGATSMDTTLPLIVRYCGSETLILAFSSGFVLSLLAPFTIIAVSMI